MEHELVHGRKGCIADYGPAQLLDLAKRCAHPFPLLLNECRIRVADDAERKPQRRVDEPNTQSTPQTSKKQERYRGDQPSQNHRP